MKIAILMSGQARFCEDTDKFIERLKSVTQADWFLHLYQDENRLHHSGAEVVAPLWTTIDHETALAKFKENLPENHKVAALEIIKNPQIPIVSTQLGSCDSSINRMFIGNYYANRLRLAYEQAHGAYDLVIKARPDLALLDDCNLVEIESLLKSSPPLSIVIPNNHRYGYLHLLINDMMAVGLPDAMTYYCNLITELTDLQIHPHPESILAYYYARHNIPVHQGNFGVDVRRFLSHGNIVHPSRFGQWA
jgi:hypothetical protein